MIELWERFGYYGMQALIVYFMVQRLGFDDSRANLVWSAAAALIYVSPAIGGWIGDKVLGTKRAMYLGAMILTLGYALMAVPTENTWFLFFALGVIVVGNGLFKPNTANLVRKIYEGDDSKIDSAFTLYYMAVNVGSTISMLATPWIKDYVNATYGNELGWHVAFAVCSVGLVLGLLNVLAMRATIAHVGSPPDERPLDRSASWPPCWPAAWWWVGLSAVILEYQALARAFVYLAGVVVLGIFVHLIRKSEPSERAGLIAALVLTLQTVFFFIFYQQMSTSLSLFALRNVDLDFTVLRRPPVDLVAGPVPGPERDLDHGAEPGPGLGLHERRPQRQGPVDRRQVRARLRRRRGRLLRLRRGRRLRRQRPDLVVGDDRRLRPLFAGRTAGLGPGPGDGGALRAGAHDRLHDGRLLRRHRHLAIPGRRGRQPGQRAEQHDRPAADPADLHQPVQQAGHGRRRCTVHAA
jgi:hypothetical protein